MYEITVLNDTITMQLLNEIRKYEFEHDTNVDVKVVYGHYSNTLYFGIYDKHGDEITINVNVHDDEQYDDDVTYDYVLNDCLSILHSILQ